MAAITSEINEESVSKASLAQCLAHVQQAQATLARSPRVRDLPRYAERNTWNTVAAALTEHYFRLSVTKDNDFTLDAVRQLYRYALAFYPLHYRLPGTYRPTWTRGALLSWLRRSIGPVTRQWYAAAITIEEPPVLTQALSGAVERLSIVDAEVWLSEALQFLDDHSLAPTRRGDLARLIYLPIAYAHLDAVWRDRTDYDAKPHQRRVLRASGQGSVGYLRRGRDIWLLADRHAAERLNDLPWIDVREHWLDLWDYRVRWIADASGQRAGGVAIELQPEVIRTLEHAAKSLLYEAGTPHYRLYRLNRLLAGFVETHRYAAGAGRQLWELDTKVRGWVQQTLAANDPDAKRKLVTTHNRLVRRLVLPVANPFLTPKRLSPTAWQAMFNPYR